MLPGIRADLGLTYTQAGSLAAAATLVYAAMQVPAGVLADRFGPRRLFATGVLGTNALLLLFTASGAYLVALLLQALSGLARALAFAPGLVLATTWFPARRRATAMGLFLAGGAVWTTLFGVMAPTVLERTDWRVLVGGWAVLGLVIGAVLAAVGRPGPERGDPASPSPTVGLRALLRAPVMWLVCVIQFARLGIVQGVGLWLPTLLVDERDLPLALAGAVVAGMALASAPTNILGGLLADRSGRPLLVIGGALVALTVALVVVAAASGLVAIALAVLLIALCQQLYFGPLFAVPLAVFGRGSAGAVSGTGNLFANLGAFVTVLALGVVKDLTGSLAAGFLLLAILGVVGVAATAALGRAIPVGAGERERAVR